MMIIWTGGTGKATTVSEEDITIMIESRADAVEIKLGGDLASALSAQEIDSSTASTGGTLLLSTDGDGVYTGLTQTDGTALSNDQFDALIIGVDVADIILEVRGVDDNGDETVSQFTSKPDGDGYAFNVPSLGASESLHLVTPSFFDGSINLTLKTLSQGSAGDTAMSASVTQTLEVYSEGDGVDLKVGDANGIEDSIVPVRLPISATRIDTSEEIVSVRLTMATEDFGSSEAAISYVTRIETRMTGIEDIKSLVAEGASFIDAATLGAETPKSVSFADLSDVSLIVRSAPGYGQNVPSLKSVTDLAGIETAMSDADIDVYAMFLRGTYTTADGNEITTSFAVEVEDASGVLTDNSMETDPVSNESVPSVAGMYAFQQNVGNAFADGIVTATPNSDDATKTDFVIDIEAAAIDLVAPLIDPSLEAAILADAPTDEQLTLLAEYDQALIQAQQWLTRNLGVDPAPDVDGQVSVSVAITTRDDDNLDSGTGEATTVAEENITITIESRADAVEIKLGGDLASALSANEIDSSTASTGGTLLLSTDGDGVYTGLTQTDDSALSNDQFDALIIGVDVADIILEVRGVDDNGDETVSQFTSKPDGDGYAFNVPSLGASETLHLVTPSFFDGSINLTLKTLSQGSAGDTAMSASVTQTLEVYSEGDGVDLKVGDANGIEDSIVPVRLPISATRIDTSEEIVSVRLTMATEDFGSSEAAISYVTRIETRMTGIEDIKSLVAEGASFIDAATLGAETPKSVSFADLSDVSLIVRSAPGYGQNVPSLKSVTDLAGIETAMSDADIDVYAMFLRGTYTTADGNEITTSFAVEDASGVLTDNSMETDPVSNESVPSVAGMYAFQQNVGNAFEDGIVTATPNSDDATKTDFVIDIEAAAIDLVAPLIDPSLEAAILADAPTDEQLTLLAEYDQALIQAQQWLTRNLGVDPAPDVDGQVSVSVAITTRDDDNLDSGTGEATTVAEEDITITIESRADAVEIKLGGDLASALSANEIDSSTASTGGTLLLSTDGDGVYTGLTQTDDSALSNDQFDALIIGVDVADIILEVRGVDDNGDETVSQFTSKPDGDGYAFNVPSLGASESLHLVTPSFFDGSINLTLKTLSQGSAGDTAMSASVTQTLEVYSEGDGVDLKVGDANGIEDSIVPVRLPISATRIDTSEEIVSVRLTMATEDFGSSEAAISYVTRIETRMTGIEDIKSLVAEGASFIDAATLGAETPKSVSFTDLSDVSLIVRSAPGYGQNVPSLKSVTDLAGIATAMSDADIDVYAMFLRGTYTTADGNEITTSFAVEDASGVLTDNSMETDPVSNESVPSVAGMYAFQQNVGNAFEGGIVTATPNSDDATKTDFVIDIEAAAIDLVAPLIDPSLEAAILADAPTDEQITLLAEYDQALIQAQQWLTRNLGVDPAPDVDGQVSVSVAITTRDDDNLDSGTGEATTVAEEDITITIESRADAVEIKLGGDLASALSANEIDSSTASTGGTLLLSTDGDGVYTGLTQTDDSALSNDQFDALIIGVDVADIILEVRGVDDNGDETVSQFTSKPDGDGYAFNVPSLGASESLHLVTPSFFDGSINLTLKTLSQGSAGDTAMSASVTQTLEVYSEGDGVDLKVGDANGIEDSIVPVRLPISATRIDTSEEIVSVRLTMATEDFGSSEAAISYVTRIETRMTGIEDIKSLVAEGASFIDAATLGAETPKSVSFTDLSDVSLIVRSAPGYGQNVPSLKSVTDLAGIATAMSDADIDVYAMFLRGTYTTADGNEITTSFAVEDASGVLTDNSMKLTLYLMSLFHL